MQLSFIVFQVRDPSIMTHSYRFFIVAAAALLTNGMSLLGLADESAGGIARALECKSCLSRSSEIISAIELGSEVLISNAPPAVSLVAVKLD